MTLQEVLVSLLQRINNGQLFATISFDEVLRWPPDALSILLDEKIIKPAPISKNIVCIGCPENCFKPVITIPGKLDKPARHYIACDETDYMGNIAVRPEQLQQWQVSQQLIIKFLYQALNNASISQDQIKAKFQKLPLDKILVFRDKGLAINVPLLTSYLAPVVTSEKESPEVNSLVLEGDFWYVRFNGETKTIKNTLGIRYIEYLIRNKGKSLHVYDLYYAVNPSDEDLNNATLSSMTAAQIGNEGLRVSDLGNAGVMMDDKGKKSLKLHIEQLDDQIEEAKEFNYIEKIEKLTIEKEQILAKLSAEFGLDGKARTTNSSIERIRKSVEKRIRTDIKKLESTFPIFAQHLTFIKTGTECQYSPIPDVIWQQLPK